MRKQRLNSGVCAVVLLATPFLVNCSGDESSVEHQPITDASFEREADAAQVDVVVETSTDVVQETGETGTTCDPSEQPPKAVFVSADKGDDTTGDGSASSPLRSVGQALELAVTNDIAWVVLDEGTYKEAIVLESEHGGLTITGGWTMDGQQWKRNCSSQARDHAVIASPTRVGLEAKHGAKEVVLRTLTVKATKSGDAVADTAGESCYGVFVHHANLSLEDVVVEACAGQSGGIAKAYVPAGAPDCSSVNPGCGNGSPGKDSTAAGNLAHLKALR